MASLYKTLFNYWRVITSSPTFCSLCNVAQLHKWYIFLHPTLNSEKARFLPSSSHTCYTPTTSAVMVLTRLHPELGSQCFLLVFEALHSHPSTTHTDQMKKPTRKSSGSICFSHDHQASTYTCRQTRMQLSLLPYKLTWHPY